MRPIGASRWWAGSPSYMLVIVHNLCHNSPRVRARRRAVGNGLGPARTGDFRAGGHRRQHKGSGLRRSLRIACRPMGRRDRISRPERLRRRSSRSRRWTASHNETLDHLLSVVEEMSVSRSRERRKPIPQPRARRRARIWSANGALCYSSSRAKRWKR